jgi:hypothetical protein
MDGDIMSLYFLTIYNKKGETQHLIRGISYNFIMIQARMWEEQGYYYRLEELEDKTYSTLEDTRRGHEQIFDMAFSKDDEPDFMLEDENEHE